LRRISVVLLALCLLLSVAAMPASGRPTGSEAGPLTFDDYLTGHLTYPAVEQAERFVARQEALGTRPPAVQEGDAYGRPGCKVPTEYEVGDTRTFWVAQNQAGNQQITATLAAKSKHGYMWVQREFYLPAPGEAPEGGFVTQGEAEAGLVDWEGIYEIDRKYFGIEPNPKSPAQNLPPGLPSNWRDADCDPRVHILNFPIDAGTGLGYTAGYYSSEHEYPNGDGEHESPFSNEAEMFFMNSLFLNVGDDTYAGVLAHEFFHMIQFSNDYNEETWVNEGMADIAAQVNGFGDIVQGHVDAYEANPDQHLFDWTGLVDDYGQAFLFFDYLFNHYGAPEVESTDELEAYGLAKLLTRTSADGAKGITKVIATRADSLKSSLDGYYRKGTFGKVFKDYLVANYVDDPDLARGQFGYANRDVAVAQTGTEDTSPDASTVHPYGADYYEVTGEGTFTSTVEDPVAVIPAVEGQPGPGKKFAWSNRADEMITWLERRADLSDATTPTLTFDYWHQIEEDWDYAYVRVSQDRGASYDFVPTPECGGRTTNPNGNNRAVTEGGGITGSSEGWKECSLDLTQWAGGPVLIRFEYDTDQATTEPGYVVDNVRLTDGDRKIWAKQTFEKRARAFDFGGDALKKWMALKPLKKNRPLVQVVQIAGDSAIRYTLTRKAFKKVKAGLKQGRARGVRGDRTIFVFSATTPIATTPFGYSYKVNR
jgi:hypothetical protein